MLENVSSISLKQKAMCVYVCITAKWLGNSMKIHFYVYYKRVFPGNEISLCRIKFILLFDIIQNWKIQVLAQRCGYVLFLGINFSLLTQLIN